MRHTNGRFALAVCLLSLGLATPCQAQDARRGGAFRMEIQNGTSLTVRYFGTSLSPGEGALLREAEAIENERAYVRDLTALKRQYVRSERLMEPVRRDVQRSLYGMDITRTSYAGDYAWGGWGMANGFPFGTYAAGVPGFNTYLYNPWASPAFAPAAFGGNTVQVTQSLANGVGDEGAMKDEIARVVARQATPEYVANLERAYDRVAMRASASPSLRVALSLPRVARGDRFRAASDETSPVTLTLKGGDKVRGDSMRETKDWISVTRAGGEVRVRAAEVVRVETRKKGAVVPASGD